MVPGLSTTVRDGVRTFVFNQNKRKNALSWAIYDELSSILNEDATNDSIVVTIFTGDGEYFSSGNDMGSASTGTEDIEAVMLRGWHSFRSFATALINYPKILIAVINGPAIGIGVTMCGLMDVVYASDRATFQTPFVNLGLCCEGASSYLFPRIMGNSKAGEVLLLGHKMTAQEAYDFNLVSRIIPHNNLEAFIEGLYKYGQLSVESVKKNKGLMRKGYGDKLTLTHHHECEQLWVCQNSDEFFNNVMAFMAKKKSKL